MPVSRHRPRHKSKARARTSAATRPLRLISLAEFLKTEGLNLDVGLRQHHKLLERFEVLNGLFHEARSHIVLAPVMQETILGALFDMTQFQLHFTVAAFLRGHRDEAFASVRKAVDAAMNAMVLQAEPGLFDAYRGGTYPFSRITRYVGASDRAATYPLGADLVGLHGICSKHASHADFASLPARIELVLGAGGRPDKQLFAWFSPHRDDPSLDHAIMIDLLKAFALALCAWEPWVVAREKGLKRDWQRRVKAFLDWATAEQVKIHRAFVAEGRPVDLDLAGALEKKHSGAPAAPGTQPLPTGERPDKN
jgi:hypothetical protein